MPQAIDPYTFRRVRKVQLITLVWMGVEAGAALVTALRAHSPALVAFSAESAVELLSAAVVLWGFRASAQREPAELRATRIAGLLLYAIAAGVVAASVITFLGYSAPKPTLWGIAILLAAAVSMPLLAREKRRAVSPDGQRSPTGGRRWIRRVRVPFYDCLGRVGCECCLARGVG